MQTALKVITSNPATILKLQQKGELKPGKDADIVLLDHDLSIQSVWAKGQHMVSEGKALVKGTFE